MAGIEVAGLALAVFPLVVEAVSWYSDTAKGRDAKHLADSLENNRQIFFNAVEQLLRSAVTAEQVQILLDDPGGSEWTEETFIESVNEHLGREANGILEKIDVIYKTVLKLQKKLPTRDSAAKDVNILTDGKYIIKCFLRGRQCKASLERLRTSIYEFRSLSKDAIKLAPLRRDYTVALRRLKFVQQAARGLHDAITASLACTCHRPHPAHIQLGMCSSNSSESNRKSNISLEFSLLLADDVSSTVQSHWISAQIAMPEAARWSQSLVDLDSLSATSSRSYASGRVHSTKTARYSLSRSTTFSIPSTVRESKDSSVKTDTIDSLCETLAQVQNLPYQSRYHLGSISDSNTHQFDLFTSTKPPDTLRTQEFIKFRDMFKRPGILSYKSRVNLALKLAWAVLQLSTSSWLHERWTKDNIFLIMDGDGNPTPYVLHHIQTCLDRSSSPALSTNKADAIGIWTGYRPLFSLAILLLELCYHKSIEDLAMDEEKRAGEFWHLLTAIRLSKVVHHEFGLSYAQAVQACLNLPDVGVDLGGRPSDMLKLERSVFKNIIEPLKTCTEWFGD